MGYYSKQLSIYISEFLLCVGFTIIAPFYPGVALSKGVPLWLIGVIFSVDPIIGLPTSLLVGKYMKSIGRRETIVIGMAAGSLGMLFLAFVESLDKDQLIFFSFLSRILAGIGAGFTLTAGEAILVGEYPEEIEIVIGRLEISSGLGFLLGPLLGTALSSYGILFSFSTVSFLFFVFTILSYFFIGKCKEYDEEVSEKLSMSELSFKPVFFTQKIFLVALIQLFLLFNLGFLMPVIEIYLRSFGISDFNIGLIFSIYTLMYAVTSIFGSGYISKTDARVCMAFGILVIGVAFLLIGIWKNIIVVIVSLAMLGLGGATMYCKI